MVIIKDNRYEILALASSDCVHYLLHLQVMFFAVSSGIRLFTIIYAIKQLTVTQTQVYKWPQTHKNIHAYISCMSPYRETCLMSCEHDLRCVTQYRSDPPG